MPVCYARFPKATAPRLVSGTALRSRPPNKLPKPCPRCTLAQAKTVSAPSSVVIVVEPVATHHSKQSHLTASKVKCRRHLASLEWYGSPGVVSYIDLDRSEFLVQHGLVLQHRLILDVVELPRSRLSMHAFDIPMPKIVPGFISIATRQCHSLRS